ncbi:class I SAM-dependent methyltransferase [Candidatus Thiosymbion oneisti]|uniref:class I SAM-dependent methyltransferase n=1 Tax=Candidatus Thiosymbion oneisti TaxID=589554 RepID=UPI000AD03D4F|nr:class I SAM-dependent methyltransferase [Candidatus Thiosymbion oneisti]
MSHANPVDLVFGGMEKLGPGSDSDTLQVLGMLPKVPHGLIVDAGCGRGRHTLALANRLRNPVHAVDSYEPFLSSLIEGAEGAGIGPLIQTYCMDMADIADRFQGIDLLWSEGAAYNIGFPYALKTWHSALKPGGFVVVSELSWLQEKVPADVRRFFKTGYSDMRSADENRVVAEDAGYRILATHTLPRATWIEGYYDRLEPRARSLLDHPDQAVRDFASETLEEIRIFGSSEDSYGYVFYVMEKV